MGRLLRCGVAKQHARWRTWLRRTLLGIVGLIVVGVIAGVVWHEPRPTGEPGPAAEAMARELQEAVNVEAWEATGAVRWTFGGRQTHLWDRERGRVETRWDDMRVRFRTGDQRGQVFRAGNRVRGDEAKDALRTAYERWINDSFWLNPVAKVFDPGTSRSIVRTEDGRRGLLVSYASGGVTPGDAYLWFAGPNGRPVAWKMWVSIIPIGGIEVPWAGWKRLSTGAWISTRHELGPITLELTEVEGAATLEALVGDEDPFAAL